MTLVGIFFIIIGFSIAVYLSNRRFLGSRKLPLLFFVYHLGLTLIYFWYSLNNPADSSMYYRTAVGPDLNFGFGTRFIEWFTQQLYVVFQASYLDFFLLFHISGFVGLCFLYRTVLEIIFRPASIRVKRATLILFFLPGIHFWTSAIGKDSIIFGGITLVLWSLLHTKSRLFGLLAGLLIIFIVRPHVAVILLGAIALARLWSHGTALPWRIFGSLAVLAVFAVALPFTMEYVKLSSLDPEFVSLYIQKRQSYNLLGGTGVDIGSYSFPLKVFTYLYRPLFFDAASLFGIVVSLENLILFLGSIMLFSSHFYKVLKLHTKSFFIRTNFFFFLFSTCIFSLVTANLGIAIRQKTMLIPSLFILILSTYSLKDYIYTKRKRRPAGPDRILRAGNR